MSLTELTETDYASRDWKEIQTIIKENQMTLDLQDQHAKQRGEIVNRYFIVPTEEGPAYYTVKDDLGSRVHIKHVTGLGKDIVCPEFGEESIIDKTYVRLRLAERDEV